MGKTQNQKDENIRLERKTDSKSLDIFIRGFEGSIDSIFEKVPQAWAVLEKGQNKNWTSIMKEGQKTISGA